MTSMVGPKLMLSLNPLRKGVDTAHVEGHCMKSVAKGNQDAFVHSQAQTLQGLTISILFYLLVVSELDSNSRLTDDR